MSQERDSRIPFADQTFVVDPRFQGFGLQPYRFLDSYANKFLMLTNADALFVSPAKVPPQQLDYYDRIGFEIAQNVVAVDRREDLPLTDLVAGEEDLLAQVSKRKGQLVVPYMMTSQVVDFAGRFGMNTLASPELVEQLGDKGVFLDRLNSVAPEVLSSTGIDLNLRFRRELAGDDAAVNDAYNEISEKSQRPAVLVKPKSASGLGIFLIDSGTSSKKLSEVVKTNFLSDEQVLVEEYVDHTHAGSMQGVSTSYGYEHLYFGKQNIAISSRDGVGTVDYSGSQVPFEATEKVEISELERVRGAHQILGEKLLVEDGINGIGGFDFLARIDPSGVIRKMKMTEVNLHLPSTVAVFAAINKLFPDGFEGVAYNFNRSIFPGTDPLGIFVDKSHLITGKNQYGVFPINLSYPDKQDLLVLARNQSELHSTIGRIAQ